MSHKKTLTTAVQASHVELQTPSTSYSAFFVGLAPHPPPPTPPPLLTISLFLVRITPFTGPPPTSVYRSPPTGTRDPNYYTDPRSIRSYRYRQSRAWQSCTSLAVVAYIAACFLGKPPFSADWGGMPSLSALQQEMGQSWGLWLECGCVLFFAFDIYLLYRWAGIRPGLGGGGARGKGRRVGSP